MNSLLGNGVPWFDHSSNITIDTRWGVPRYNPTSETETYLLNKEQLTPVAHRGELIARSTGDKRFYQRIEKDFARIIRHGDGPTNYWWEVTDKEGVVSYYGGLPDVGILQEAVLTDESGNIAKWAIVESRDLNDNFTRYEYALVEDPGVEGGQLMGYQLYPKRIFYDGHGQEKGKYQVTFIRDRQLGEARRKDVQIDARWGFKQVTADLLRKVVVSLENEVMRSYDLAYTEGAFQKSLLSSITEYDAGGAVLDRQEFTYYDDVRKEGTYDPYAEAQVWLPKDDQLRVLFDNARADINGNATTLAGVSATSDAHSMSITHDGFNGSLNCKTQVIGAYFSYSHTEEEGLVALVDVNGDQLPDKVFVKGEEVFYRANRTGASDDNRAFADPRPMLGLSRIYEAASSSSGSGFEAQTGSCTNIAAFMGLKREKGQRTVTTYFADGNGDGLMDLVIDGQVWYNQLNEESEIVFTTSSLMTTNPIDESIGVDPNMAVFDSVAFAEAIEQHPLHDIVRFWEAPMDGRVVIGGSLELLADASPARAKYLYADGVRASIELRDSMYWSREIGPEEEGAPVIPSVDTISITAGERIYFRVHSIFDGAYDQVDWNPTITYVDYPQDVIDANNKSLYQYEAADDFLVTAPIAVSAPFDGQVSIEGKLVKPITSDSIRLEIWANKPSPQNNILELIYTLDYAWDETADTLIYHIPDRTVLRNDRFEFRIFSRTNVDWSGIQWKPRLYYTEAVDDEPIPTAVMINERDTLLEFFPVVEYELYNDPVVLTQEWTVPDSGLINPSLSISPLLAFSRNLPGTVEVIFSVKRGDNQPPIVRPLTLRNGQIIAPEDLSIEVPYRVGEHLFIEYHTKNRRFARTLTQSEAQIQILVTEPNSDTILYQVGAGFHSIKAQDEEEAEYTFGSMHRHWGQFVYNANGERATMPIIDSLLRLDSALLTRVDSIVLQTDFVALDSVGQTVYQPSLSPFVMLYPNQRLLDGAGGWSGYDRLTYIQGSIMSSSRMGLDQLIPLSTLPEGAGVRAVRKVHQTTSISYSSPNSESAGLEVEGNLGTTKSQTKVISDFIDLNGDGYPDNIVGDKVQYTTATGQLREVSIPQAWHSSYTLRTETKGVGVNGLAYPSSSIDDQIGIGQQGAIAEPNAGLSAGGLGTPGALATSTDTLPYRWLDVNGDQLPDRVYEEGQVSLNLGYRFAPVEDWGYAQPLLSTSVQINGGDTLGISLGSGSYTSGYGLTKNEQQITRSLQDINGDGLIDELIQADQVLVRFNTGSGFSEPILWKENPAIALTSAHSESINEAYTVCLPIPFGGPSFKICYNPAASQQKSMQRQDLLLKDIDGDGYADLLTSDKDNRLMAARSKIGRTNRLKSIKNLQGAVVEYDYDRYGNTVEMPNSVWMMSLIKVYDGFSGDGVDTTVTKISYADGRYDRRERAFLGFGKVKVDEIDPSQGDAVYRSVIRTYDNDNYFEQGLLLSELWQDSEGKKYIEKSYDYELRDVLSGDVLDAAAKGSDAGAAFPALMSSTEQYYEGLDTATISSITTYEYDRFGNLLRQRETGQAGISDDRIFEYSYHEDESKHLLAILRSVQLRDVNGQMYRQMESEINPTTGQIRRWNRSINASEVATYEMEYDQRGNLTKYIYPENHRGERFYRTYTYDSLVGRYPVNVADAHQYVETYEYDYRFGKVIRHIDANGQETQIILDDAGRVDQLVGPNELADGLSFTVDYDYFLTDSIPWKRIRRHDPEHPNNPLESIEIYDGLGRLIQEKRDIALFVGPGMEDEEQMRVSGRIQYDAFGRIIETGDIRTEAKGQAEVYNASVASVPAQKFSYDILDRQLSKTASNGDEYKWAYGFGTDREGKTRFQTTSIRPSGRQEEIFYDLSGSEIARKRFLAGSPIWTSNNYNIVEELLSSTDVEDNTSSYTYDWAGQMLSQETPNNGLITYSYDQAGNLRSKITPNLRSDQGDQPITYSYEFERLTDIAYPLNPRNNVKYQYGEAGAPDNTAGRLIFQGDGSGYQLFTYDRLGQVQKNTRHIIVIPERPGRTYTTRYNYDTWGRIQEMVYPDTEVLEYGYNLGGEATSLSGSKLDTDYRFVKQQGYNKYSQPIYQAFGNDLVINKSFDPLDHTLIGTSSKTAEGRVVFDDIYTYDKEHNLLSIQNNVPLPAPYEMGGAATYDFEYDDLNRLVNAKGQWESASQQQIYELGLERTTIGHILRKNQIHRRNLYALGYWQTSNFTSYNFDYSYSPAVFGRPTQIGNWVYEYDDNGNMLAREEDFFFGQLRSIEWDEENRMTTLDDDEQNHAYTYDADDDRVTKREEVGQFIYINGELVAVSDDLGEYTIYINPFMEVSSAGYTKHYFLEGIRIGSKVGLGGPFGLGSIWGDWESWFFWEPWDNWANNDNWKQSDPPYNNGNWQDPDNNWNDWQNTREFHQYFFHQDIFGNTRLITDVQGEVHQHMEYFPLGETFIQEHKNVDRYLYLFQDQLIDEETGLYFRDRRYYDPQISQWFSWEKKNPGESGKWGFGSLLFNGLPTTRPDFMREVKEP